MAENRLGLIHVAKEDAHHMSNRHEDAAPLMLCMPLMPLHRCSLACSFYPAVENGQKATKSHSSLNRLLRFAFVFSPIFDESQGGSRP